ncbi:TadE/TadG family type IV pilus assembly protein [Avibacterium paragallinarum]|uniref:TadE/TadG family type IV pilus assembly protein n=1 Tax=Avibacterium paragallinarum TaxID=728 RepID=UPI0039858B1C
MPNLSIYRKAKSSFSLFLRHQNGGYSVIMGMITVFILVIIGFTIDGSGVLLDRARLSDSLEQAALAITAENNQFRNDDYILGDVRTQNGVTIRTRNDKEVKKRDEKIIKGFLDSYSNGYSQTQNIHYYCEKASNRILCNVEGTRNRTSLLPMNINKDVFIPTHINLTQQGTAVKGDKGPPPLDIMFAVNFSDDIFTGVKQAACSIKASNMSTPRHIEQLGKCGTVPFGSPIVESLKEYIKVLNVLTPQKGEKNTHNRIGLTAFSLGAQPINQNKDICALPFKFKADKRFNDPLFERQRFLNKAGWKYTISSLRSTISAKEMLETALNTVDNRLFTRTLVLGHRFPLFSNTSSLDSVEIAAIISKYLPLALDIWPEDLKRDFELGKEGKKRKWYDLRPEPEYLNLDLDYPYEAVFNTIDQIVAPHMRAAYVAYRQTYAPIKAKIEEARQQGRTYQLTPQEKQALQMALNQLKQGKDVDGYGVSEKVFGITDNWLIFNKRNAHAKHSGDYNRGFCFDYSGLNGGNLESREDSKWFTTPTELIRSLDYNSSNSHAGGAKLAVSGLLMGAYNMANSINQTALPENVGSNTKRVLVVVDTNLEEDASIVNTDIIREDDWQYTLPNPYTREDGKKITLDANWTKANSRHMTSNWYYDRHNNKVYYNAIRFYSLNDFYKLITPAFLKDGYNEPSPSNPYPSPTLCDAIRARLITSPFQNYDIGEVYDPEIVYIQFRHQAYNVLSQTDKYWQQCADNAFFIGVSDSGGISQEQNQKVLSYFKGLNQQISEAKGNTPKKQEEVGHSLHKK